MVQSKRYGTWLGSLLLLAVVRPAAADEPTCSEIPVLLVGKIDPPTYPDPICLRCKVKVTRSSSEGPAAHLWIEYEGGASQTFEGDLELEVLLSNDTWVPVTIPAELEEGEDYQFGLEDGSAWEWNDVEYVRVELVPT